MEDNMTTTPTGSNNAGSVIGWLDKVLGLEAKYGVGRIISAFMIMFIAIVMGIIAFNPNLIVREVEKYQQQAHNEALVKRLEADPIIRADLVELRTNLCASRTFVMETHNGGTNLTGLPFLYVDMTYDEPSDGIIRLEGDYKNFRLSRYPFADFVYREQYWFGSVDEVKEIDNELYYRLVNDGATHLGIIVMYGTYNPSGVLGVTYSENDVVLSDTDVRRELTKFGSKIGRLLNNE